MKMLRKLIYSFTRPVLYEGNMDMKVFPFSEPNYQKSKIGKYMVEILLYLYLCSDALTALMTIYYLSPPQIKNKVFD